MMKPRVFKMLEVVYSILLPTADCNPLMVGGVVLERLVQIC